MPAATQATTLVEFTHFHLFCGIGGGARGFNDSPEARLGSFRARMRCIGGVDNDAGALKDFERLTGAPGTMMDLFSALQFAQYHAACASKASKRCKDCNNTGLPPAGWREVTPADLRLAAGGRSPDVVFTSAPCRGFSGLLSAQAAATDKYGALNGLTVRGIDLTLRAFEDDPPSLIIFENVPGITKRGAALLEEIERMLKRSGYVVAQTRHDCGEFGGLAQHRTRFLLVARHAAKMPAFVYEPPRLRVRGIGEVIGELPVPLNGAGGPMHQPRRLDFQTYLKLALIEPGKDWRDLAGKALEHFTLQRAESVNGYFNGVLGVQKWSEPAPTVTSRQGAYNSSASSVSDPRGREALEMVSANNEARKGRRFNNVFVLRGWDQASVAITAGGGPSSGGVNVADPRLGARLIDNGPLMDGLKPPGGEWAGAGKYRITKMDEASGAVIARTDSGNGGFAVADPRITSVKVFNEEGEPLTEYPGPSVNPLPGWSRTPDGDHPFTSGGHYGVTPWDGASKAVTGSANLDNGFFSVSDPRLADPDQNYPWSEPGERGVFIIIRASDLNWHRPLTTAELAAIQGYPIAELMAQPLAGSDTTQKLHIGNSVPPPASSAIGGVFLDALLAARLNQTFRLSAEPIWVQPQRDRDLMPIRVALSIASPEEWAS